MLAINISDKKAITTSYLESELEDIPEQRLYGKSLYVFDEFAQEISTPFRLIPDDVDDDKYTFEVRWYGHVERFNSIRACLYFYLDLIKRHDLVIVYIIDLEEATTNTLWTRETLKLLKNANDTNCYFFGLYPALIKAPFSKIVAVSDPQRILWDIKREEYKNSKGYLITDDNHNVISCDHFLYNCIDKILELDEQKRKSYSDTLFVKSVSIAQTKVIGKIYLDVISNYLAIYRR